MKNIKLFILKSCPFCIQALDWQDKILKENPQYQNVPIEIIDESVEYELAESYDYYYVPSYFIDEVKVYEGVCTRQIIESVFEEAYKE